MFGNICIPGCPWPSQGTTNKKEWDSFVRSKERFRVHEYYSTKKLELFNMWLDSGKSWDQTVLKVKGIHQDASTAKSGWIAMQGRDIKAKLGTDKGEQVITSRKDAGLYYKDADFPDCDDDL